jgi:transcription elongation GreA/GreB family factor
MDKNAIKQALIKLERHHIDEAEMKYEDFLMGNLLDREEIVDQDDQSHHRQSIEVSDQLEHQAHVHIDHLKAIKTISFEPTEVVKPGAIVSINGRCMIVAVPKAPFSIDGRQFMGISVNAPIYQHLEGKKAGDTFEFNNKKFTIEVVN